MKHISTTVISASCLLALLFIAPSAVAKKAKPKSRTSKAAATNPNAKFQDDTNAVLREINSEMKTKLTQDDLKGIRDDLKKVEQKADETALEVRIVMIVGVVVALLLGVLIYRLSSKMPDSSLSIT